MAKQDNYLADEVHRALNRLPLTRGAKRAIRNDLLKDMDEQHAIQFTYVLKTRIEGLAALIDVIHRSRDISLGGK